MSDSELKCPHCGKQPDGAIEAALNGCPIGDAYEQLTRCSECGGEIGISVSREAFVQRRGKGLSDADLEAKRAARTASSLQSVVDGSGSHEAGAHK